jgi:hypothetical protein
VGSLEGIGKLSASNWFMLTTILLMLAGMVAGFLNTFALNMGSGFQVIKSFLQMHLSLCVHDLLFLHAPRQVRARGGRLNYLYYSSLQGIYP